MLAIGSDLGRAAAGSLLGSPAKGSGFGGADAATGSSLGLSAGN